MDERTVVPHTQFRDSPPSEPCEDCGKMIPNGDGWHRCKVPAKRQQITLEVECLERLHDPADMGWQFFMTNAIAPGDIEAARHARVRVVASEEVIR